MITIEQVRERISSEINYKRILMSRDATKSPTLKSQIDALKSMLIYTEQPNALDRMNEQLDELLKLRDAIHAQQQDAVDRYGMGNTKLIDKQRARVARETGLAKIEYKIGVMQHVLNRNQ